MYICAGGIEEFENTKSIGIGLMEAAINLTKICIEEKPKELIFLGSAGSYGTIPIFDIVHSSAATNIEASFFSNDSYSPIENIVSCETSSTIVNSSNYILTSKSLSKFYEKEKISIENMEFYAVLKVAKKFRINAKGIFVVTNYCNKNAHNDFLMNHKKAIGILSDYIQRNSD